MTSMYTHTITLPSSGQTQTLRLVAPSPAYAPITTQWIRRPEVTQYLGAEFFAHDGERRSGASPEYA